MVKKVYLMAKYKVLMPVLAERQRLEHSTAKIEDKSKLIVLHNYPDPETLEIGKKLATEGATVLPFIGKNRGSPVGWNIGLKEFEKSDIDFVLICAASDILYRGMNYTMDAMASMYEKNRNIGSIAIDGSHCWAITRAGFDRVGTFDENILPWWCEDTDWGRREYLSGCVAAELSPRDSWDVCQKYSPEYYGHVLNKPDEISVQFGANVPLIRKYLVAKWGIDFEQLMHLNEGFRTPYNSGASLKHWIPNYRKDVVEAVFNLPLYLSQHPKDEYFHPLKDKCL